VLNEKDSIPLIRRAYDLGINFFDTADVYSNGESERILGKALQQYQIPRSNVVIATKCFYQVSNNISVNTLSTISKKTPETINSKGLSRRHIFEAVDASLQRLQTTYIDLLQIHRWDADTPIEETMEALHDLIRMGKVRYIGASSMYTWQFAKAQFVAEKNNWTKFSSMQNLYNLVYREEEREMIPFCVDQNVGIIPWSPLARGVLSGKKESSTRRKTDKNIARFFGKGDNNDAIVQRVKEIAEKREISCAQVAIAWLLSKPYVTAPIVGVNKRAYLEDVVAGVKVKLSDEESKSLEELYTPRKITGH
jgi:aryl-alcohol dehydrogenase-like predicted oxidoreductase